MLRCDFCIEVKTICSLFESYFIYYNEYNIWRYRKLAQKKSYSRYFIILQEDEKGYSLASDKIASGYAKLEMKNDKCKISYYVQNLKKEKTPYYMILICNKRDMKNIIKIGEMNIDDYGRADVCYEYPIDDVAGSGISMDRVSGAAIVRILDNNIISVMSGFASTEIPKWKDFAIIENRKESPEGEEDNKVEELDNGGASEVDSKSIFDKYEESIEKVKKDEEDMEKNHVDEEDKGKKIPESGEIPEEDNKRTAEDSLESKIKKDLEVGNEGDSPIYVDNSVTESYKEAELKRHKCKKAKGISQPGNYPQGPEGDFFNNLMNGFKETKSICNELKRCRWYKIPVNSMEDMYNMNDYNKYALIYYPMMSYYPYIKKHCHYLSGYKCDKKGRVKYLIYGILGTKDKRDQPYGGKSGFVTWVSLRDKDKIGYWLMFYDFKTNTVVIPVKK
jgi:hypothetical protein